MDDALAQFEAALAGRYRGERALGRGGPAKVYLAEARQDRGKVGIQGLRPEHGRTRGREQVLYRSPVRRAL